MAGGHVVGNVGHTNACCKKDDVVATLKWLQAVGCDNFRQATQDGGH